MSTPANTSGRRVLAEASAGTTFTGPEVGEQAQLFAQPQESLLRRTAARGSLHFGPPTAPSSTASPARQAASDSSGSGSPVSSMAIPPTSASVKVNVWPKRAATASSTLRPSATTSGPMPSAGKKGDRSLHTDSLINCGGKGRRPAGNPAGGKRRLQVIPAGVGIQVQHLAGKI